MGRWHTTAAKAGESLAWGVLFGVVKDPLGALLSSIPDADFNVAIQEDIMIGQFIPPAGWKLLQQHLGAYKSMIAKIPRDVLLSWLDVISPTKARIVRQTAAGPTWLHKTVMDIIDLLD